MQGERGRMDWPLQNQLRHRHPVLSHARNTSMAEYPIACGNGWYDLIDRTASRLLLAGEDGAPIELIEIKEKFGALRIRWRATAPMTAHHQYSIRSILDHAEHASLRICETCGEPGQLQREGGSFSARCLPHRPPH